ncbi:acyclic terpene utilization AtuA family protein [Polaromonas hydrogenivorans]
MKSRNTLRIGGASAFWGDSNKGVEQLVHDGDVDVLVFDYLAELTMSILASAKSKNPDLGYATDFVSALASVLPTIAARKTLVLSNAGGMNPQACARALRKLADAAGVSLRIAVVEGDDLLPICKEIQAAGVREMFSGTALPDNLTSLNAYLGAFPIVEALKHGADVVITGRCADSALALAALIHRFDWSAQDYDRLAAGSLVGHILECTTQATGGLFTDWWQVPGWDNMGYPIAECDSEGSFVLSKPVGTGGLIKPLVVSEQMLYEITDPANYLLPDVSCDFTGVTILEAGDNKVRVSGARGHAPTPTYKVSATWRDGYRLSTNLTVVGDNAIQKAQRAAEAIVKRTRKLIKEDGHVDYSEVNIEVLGSEIPSYGAQSHADAREVVVRLSARHSDPVALSILGREVAPMGTAGAPGTTGFSGRPKAQPVFRLFSFLWDKSKVAISIEMDNEHYPVVITTTGQAWAVAAGQRYTSEVLPVGERVVLPLSALAVARSGDKGDVAHVAIIARKPKFAALIGEQITANAVGNWFTHLTRGSVTRYDVPGVHAFNFVLQEALGGGGATSLRNDPLGKTFGQVLLSHPVTVPLGWVSEADTGYPGKLPD